MTNTELDALIAERVMGWKRGNPYGNASMAYLDSWCENGKGIMRGNAWHPTEDISQAMQAVEKMREEQNTIRMFGDEGYNSGMWGVRIYNPVGELIGEGRDETEGPERGTPSLPLAICKAIASAIGDK